MFFFPGSPKMIANFYIKNWTGFEMFGKSEQIYFRFSRISNTFLMSNTNFILTSTGILDILAFILYWWYPLFPPASLTIYENQPNLKFLSSHVSHFYRFKEGLKTLGVLDAIGMHPDSFRPLMCHEPSPLTADLMDQLFHIRLSAVGSNKRQAEERVVPFWRDYLQDVEGKYY